MRPTSRPSSTSTNVGDTVTGEMNAMLDLGTPQYRCAARARADLLRSLDSNANFRMPALTPMAPLLLYHQQFGAFATTSAGQQHYNGSYNACRHLTETVDFEFHR